MIKFNETTWYSKLATIIICLGIFPAIVFVIGMKYQQVQEVVDSIPSIESEAGNTNQLPSQMEDGTTVSSTTPASGDIRVYTNKKSGWHFQYPSDWNIAEKADGSGVTIESGVMVEGIMGTGVKSPIFTLSFITKKKADFEEVGTKVGQIKFDMTKNALVDIGGPNIRCLPVNSKLGTTASIPTFQYAGSMMSDPAYSTSAVISDKDFLVIINMLTYGRVEDDMLEADIENGLRTIYSTFGLGGNTVAVTPECTQLSSAR